jgi:hypothetical protein
MTRPYFPYLNLCSVHGHSILRIPVHAHFPIKDSTHTDPEIVQASKGPLTKRDQALNIICHGCIDVSRELITRLERLKLSQDQKHRKWESFKLTVKTVWSKEKIEETASKLVRTFPSNRPFVTISGPAIYCNLSSINANSELIQAGEAKLRMDLIPVCSFP